MKRRIYLIASFILLIAVTGFGESLAPLMRDIGLVPLGEGTKYIDFELPDLKGGSPQTQLFRRQGRVPQLFCHVVRALQGGDALDAKTL